MKKNRILKPRRSLLTTIERVRVREIEWVPKALLSVIFLYWGHHPNEASLWSRLANIAPLLLPINDYYKEAYPDKIQPLYASSRTRTPTHQNVHKHVHLYIHTRRFTLETPYVSIEGFVWLTPLSPPSDKMWRSIAFAPLLSASLIPSCIPPNGRAIYTKRLNLPAWNSLYSENFLGSNNSIGFLS